MKRTLNVLNLILYFLAAVFMAIGYKLMKTKSAANGFTKEILKKYHMGLIFKDIAIYFLFISVLFTAVRFICKAVEKRKNS